MEGSPDEAALPAPFMYAPEAPAPEAPPAPVEAPAPAPQPVPVAEPAPAPAAQQMPLRGKLRAPIPKEARADPFAKMKKSTGKHYKKPSHRPPSGLQGTCAWNCSLGRWEADVKLKPRDGDYVFSEDYRSWVRQRSAAPAPAQAPFAFDDDSSNDDEDPPPKRACPEPNKRRRPFQPSWKTVLPMGRLHEGRVRRRRRLRRRRRDTSRRRRPLDDDDVAFGDVVPRRTPAGRDS